LAASLIIASSLVGTARAGGAPDLVAAKSSDAVGTQSVGSTFSFTISVTNQGDADAQKVVLSDNLPIGMKVVGHPVASFGDGSCLVASSVSTDRPEAWSVYCKSDSLAAGETASATFGVLVTAEIRCGEVANEAHAEAKNEPSADHGNNTATASIDVACTPSLSMTKSGPAYGHVGDEVVFTMRVTNTGKVAFGDVSVRDPGCATSPSRVSDGNGDAELGPREAWTYRCTAKIPKGTGRLFTTTGTAVGHSPDGNARANAHATVRVLRPHLSIVVTPDPASGTPGDTVTYRYVVRNVGDAVLTDITVTDDRLGSIGSVPQLAPGHAVTFHADRVLSATDVWVTNTATASGDDPSGRSVRATGAASVSIVADAGQGSGSDPNDGTAFTGTDAGDLALIGLDLAVIGLALLRAARRRT